MAMSREEVCIWFISMVDKLDPGNPNVQMYKDLFSKMSNKEFEDMVDKLESGEMILSYTQPNLGKYSIKMKNIFKVADEISLKLMQRLLIIDDSTGLEYLTPIEYLVVDMPIKRQAQHITKKRSFPDNSSHTDILTGQVIGVAKTSRMTLPETMILESLGLTKAVEELIKIRGGDNLAGRRAKRDMVETGSYSLEKLEELDSRPTSTQTMSNFLYGMMFENNL